MRRAAKIDSNHREIVALFESYGCVVMSTARLGEGFPDLLVSWQDRMQLVEVKTKASHLNPLQTAWMVRHNVRVWLVRDPRDVTDCVTWLKRQE